jgi:hypothetical protein
LCLLKLFYEIPTCHRRKPNCSYSSGKSPDSNFRLSSFP